MRPSRQALTVTLIVLMVAGGAGCGDDANPAPASSPLSAEFAEQAAEICAQGRLQGLRFQPAKGAQSERAALSEAIKRTLLPAMQGVIGRISALSAQHEEASTKAFLTAMQQAVSQAEALDTPTMEATETLLAKPGKLARRLGLEACVYG